MLYKIRTGDILLAENKQKSMTNMYLVTYDSADGFTLLCVSCGEKVGSYGTDKELLEKNIKEFLNVVKVIPKEVVVDFVNQKYKPRLSVRCHDIREEHELGIEMELP